MRWSINFLVPVMVLAACVPALAQTPTYKLGRTPSEEEIRAWDIAIGPEGKELPPGSGTAKEGATIFAQKCAHCHGPRGETPFFGGTKRLVGAQGSLTTPDPIRTIGSFWPFATTVWDIINRAMPENQEGSLSPNEVYALTAVLLYWNGIIHETDVMDAKSLPKVRMPNRNGLVPAKPESGCLSWLPRSNACSILNQEEYWARQPKPRRCGEKHSCVGACSH